MPLYNSIPKYLPREKKMYLYTDVHIDLIHDICKLETVQMAISWWMDNPFVVDIYIGILLSNKKGMNWYNNVVKYQEYYGEQKKTDERVRILYDFIYVNF